MPPFRYKVIWSFRANEDLADIYEYIEIDSSKAANKVIDIILDLGNSLEVFPTKFPKEKNLKDAPKVFRSVSKWNYKIIYTIRETDTTVIISRVFDTRQSPEKMKV